MQKVKRAIDFKGFLNYLLDLEGYHMNHTETIFEQLGGTYTQVGDYFLPDLIIAEAEHPLIGKYGRMRKRHLKGHRPVLFTNLLLSGKLDQHLAEIDHACIDQMELLARQMADREGVSETLKAADQFEWVRRMNSILDRAEEVVLHELIYY